MNRNQLFTTLEILDDTFRVVVGEYKNDDYYIHEVFYKKSEGIIDFKIEDENDFYNSLLAFFEEIKEKRDIDLKKLIFSLPSKLINLDKINYTIPIKGKENIVSLKDKEETIKKGLKYKEKEKKDEYIVSCIPYEFITNKGDVLDYFPQNYKTHDLRIKASILSMDKEQYLTYINSLKKIGFTNLETILDFEALETKIKEFEHKHSLILDISLNKSTLYAFKRSNLIFKIEKNSFINKLILDIEENFKIGKKEALSLLDGKIPLKSKNTKNISVIKSKKGFLKDKEITLFIEEKVKSFLTNILNDLQEKKEDLSFEKIYIVGKLTNTIDIQEIIEDTFQISSQILKPKKYGFINSSEIQGEGLIEKNYEKMNTNKMDTSIKEENKDLETKDFEDFIINPEEIE